MQPLHVVPPRHIVPQSISSPNSSKLRQSLSAAWQPASVIFRPRKDFFPPSADCPNCWEPERKRDWARWPLNTWFWLRRRCLCRLRFWRYCSESWRSADRWTHPTWKGWSRFSIPRYATKSAWKISRRAGRRSLSQLSNKLRFLRVSLTLRRLANKNRQTECIKFFLPGQNRRWRKCCSPVRKVRLGLLKLLRLVCNKNVDFIRNVNFDKKI